MKLLYPYNFQSYHTYFCIFILFLLFDVGFSVKIYCHNLHWVQIADKKKYNTL